MKFLISVIDTETRSLHTPEEIAAINQINEEMVNAGYRIFAGGLDSLSTAKLFDYRNSATHEETGALHKTEEFVSGFWIVEVPNRDVAEELARKGSIACNRKVEIRPLLGN